MMARLCDALAYLHEQPGPWGCEGTIHCDVCPENVIVESAESVKLIDLGSACAPCGLGRVGAPAASLVAPRVKHLQDRAPERVRCLGLDGRSDVYAVGVMLYELVHGALPFPAGETQETVRHICAGDVLGGAAFVEPGIAELVADAMRVDPAERVPSARDFATRALAVADRLDGGRVAPLVMPDQDSDTLRPAAGSQLDREVHELLRTMRSEDARRAAVDTPWIDARPGSPRPRTIAPAS
jgi:serine/threonine protein kinase